LVVWGLTPHEIHSLVGCSSEARLRRTHESSLIVDNHFEEKIKINDQNTYEIKARLSGGNYREESEICEGGPGLRVHGFGHVGCGAGAC
jgi:hypothetical protein